MSLKIPRRTVEIDELTPARAWLRNASARLRSLLYAMTKSYYRAAASGAVLAVVTLGLLLLALEPARHHAATPVAASRSSQSHSQPHGQPSAASHSSQAPRAAPRHSSRRGPGQASAGTQTSPRPWLTPTAQPSELGYPSPAPTRTQPASPQPQPSRSHPSTPPVSPPPSSSPPPYPSPTPTPSSSSPSPY